MWSIDIVPQIVVVIFYFWEGENYCTKKKSNLEINDELLCASHYHISHDKIYCKFSHVKNI